MNEKHEEKKKKKKYIYIYIYIFFFNEGSRSKWSPFMKVVYATSRASNNETLNCELFLLYFQIPCYSCDFKSVKKKTTVTCLIICLFPNRMLSDNPINATGQRLFTIQKQSLEM